MGPLDHPDTSRVPHTSEATQSSKSLGGLFPSYAPAPQMLHIRVHDTGCLDALGCTVLPLERCGLGEGGVSSPV